MKAITKHSDGSVTAARTDGKIIRLTPGQARRWLTDKKGSSK